MVKVQNMHKYVHVLYKWSTDDESLCRLSLSYFEYMCSSFFLFFERKEIHDLNAFYSLKTHKT